MSRTFLLIGLSAKNLPAMVGPDKAPAMAEIIAAAIKRDAANFAAAGMGVVHLSVEADEDMAGVEAKLKERKYDGVVIGFGLRSHKDFTPLFERIVNTVHTASPSSRVLFNAGPDGSLEAVRRWFPEIASA